jgi:hypothetical protein
MQSEKIVREFSIIWHRLNWPSRRWSACRERRARHAEEKNRPAQQHLSLLECLHAEMHFGASNERASSSLQQTHPFAAPSKSSLSSQLFSRGAIGSGEGFLSAAARAESKRESFRIIRLVCASSPLLSFFMCANPRARAMPSGISTHVHTNHHITSDCIRAVDHHATKVLVWKNFKWRFCKQWIFIGHEILKIWPITYNNHVWTYAQNKEDRNEFIELSFCPCN